MPPLSAPLLPHLVIGGCRSGKSLYAETLVKRLPPPYCYLATARVGDQETADRVARHRSRRGSDWETIEAPLEPLAAIRRLPTDGRPILLDCVTMWLTNLLLDRGADAVFPQVDELCRFLRAARPPLVLVSNEVGQGIVPENDLARTFRDLAGSANQRIAAACTAVTWMVAGLPVPLKPAAAFGFAPCPPGPTD